MGESFMYTVLRKVQFLKKITLEKYDNFINRESGGGKSVIQRNTKFIKLTRNKIFKPKESNQRGWNKQKIVNNAKITKREEQLLT